MLAAMGRPVRVGPTGTGQLAKLANQAIVGITIGAVAEATLLLEAGGADPAAVRDALKGGFADSTILQLHGARMSARDYTPGGPSAIQLKDMDNVLDAAQGLTLPLTQAIRDRYARLVEDLGGGANDHAALFEELRDLQ
ncbi:MAG: NAD-binding protein [Pseudomonadota bacterium]